MQVKLCDPCVGALRVCVLHCVSKTFYISHANLDIHDLIKIIFSRSVTEKIIRSQTMLCFPTSPIKCFCVTLRNRKSRRQRIGALCAQHSPNSAVLSTSFILNHALDSPQLNALITRFRESYSSVSMSLKSKTLKKSSSWLDSGNALIQHLSERCNFYVPRCAR